MWWVQRGVLHDADGGGRSLAPFAPEIILRSLLPLARGTAKKLRSDTEDSPLAISIELEQNCRSRMCRFEDFREGVEAFHGKRRPRFSGR